MDFETGNWTALTALLFLSLSLGLFFSYRELQGRRKATRRPYVPLKPEASVSELPRHLTSAQLRARLRAFGVSDPRGSRTELIAQLVQAQRTGALTPPSFCATPSGTTRDEPSLGFAEARTQLELEAVHQLELSPQFTSSMSAAQLGRAILTHETGGASSLGGEKAASCGGRAGSAGGADADGDDSGEPAVDYRRDAACHIREASRGATGVQGLPVKPSPPGRRVDGCRTQRSDVAVGGVACGDAAAGSPAAGGLHWDPFRAGCEDPQGTDQRVVEDPMEANPVEAAVPKVPLLSSIRLRVTGYTEAERITRYAIVCAWDGGIEALASRRFSEFLQLHAAVQQVVL